MNLTANITAIATPNHTSDYTEATFAVNAPGVNGSLTIVFDNTLVSLVPEADGLVADFLASIAASEPIAEEPVAEEPVEPAKEEAPEEDDAA